MNQEHPQDMAGNEAMVKRDEGPQVKRRRSVPRDNIAGITKPALRRVARRGGVKRVAGGVYDESRVQLRQFLDVIVRDAVTYTEHGNRKTVTASDVAHSLKRNGHTLYGIGGDQ